MWNSLSVQTDDASALSDLLEEEYDTEVASEINREILDIEKRLNDFETRVKLSGEHDYNNAIICIHPGAGGTESQDWAQMLFRMYLRWSERKGYTNQVLDLQPGEEAGIKSVTFMLYGEYAYGYSKAETGVHRLVRISPFDANKRRHTSFASVFVYPEIDDDIEIEIDESDLKIDTFRSSGAGGQHVNVTDSAVRITHLPTGTVVQCQNERSQHKNKASAMKVLKARLYELEEAKKREELKKTDGEKKDISWGNQIRSYVLHPYRMIKDLRTQLETGNVDAVLDGDLDRFIEAYLLKGA